MAAREAPPEDNTIVPMPGGPLHVRGRVQLRSADGALIVRDMRLALCRCGHSHNKPSCDNSHRAISFDDRGAVADGGTPAETNEEVSITASANGPLLVRGAFSLRAADEQASTEPRTPNCAGQQAILRWNARADRLSQ
jgi:CDGSH-type Zn-finger protein